MGRVEKMFDALQDRDAVCLKLNDTCTLLDLEVLKTKGVSHENILTKSHMAGGRMIH